MLPTYNRGETLRGTTRVAERDDWLIGLGYGNTSRERELGPVLDHIGGVSPMPPHPLRGRDFHNQVSLLFGRACLPNWPRSDGQLCILRQIIRGDDQRSGTDTRDLFG